MRIPHINKMRLEPSEPGKLKTETIDVDIEPEGYLDDMALFEDKKERLKFIYRTEAMTRKSFEYTELIKHLKLRHGMDHCGIHPNMSMGHGIRIELHHTPFQLSDITSIVIKKRLERNESMKQSDIIHEIMEIHYLGLVGLYPLCQVCHVYAHSDQGDDLFIPIANVYGDPDRFWDLYSKYAPASIQTKYENIQTLNRGYSLITENIPEALVKKYIYVRPKDKHGKETDMEVISTTKLVDFIKDLNNG